MKDKVVRKLFNIKEGEGGNKMQFMILDWILDFYAFFFKILIFK